MGVGDTNAYPSRTAPVVSATRAPGLPSRMAGGFDGPAPLPGRSVVEFSGFGGLPANPNIRVAGGIAGTRDYVRPLIDNLVPGRIGAYDGHSLRGPGSGIISWWRGYFDNKGGIEAFKPLRSGTPSWTQNNATVPPAVLSDIPFSRKHYNSGALRRGYNCDSQLFLQLPTLTLQRPWNARRTLAQPQQQSPSQPKLTRFTPAAAYGQTTQVLSLPLTNLLRGSTLPSSDPNGSTFGAY